MKRLAGILRTSGFYSLLSFFLVIILLFGLAPNSVQAQSNQTVEHIQAIFPETFTSTPAFMPSAIESQSPPTGMTGETGPTASTTPIPNPTPVTSPTGVSSYSIGPNPTPPPLGVSANSTTPDPIANLNKVTVKVIPGQDTEITSASSSIKLNIPRGATAVPLTVDMIESNIFQSSGTTAIRAFDLDAVNSDTLAVVSQFSQNLQITIQNQDFELQGLDPASIRLYYLNETTRNWTPLANSQFDQTTKIMTATTNHFSHYAEMANPLISGPGRVMAAQVDLQSGSATYSYPIDLPTGPGGFKPKLELIYNSSSVDEMKNKCSTSSWVGIGWTLQMPRITLDPGSKEYYLDLNGASYKLITTDGINFRTNPEQYYKITYNASLNLWEMRDREGTDYQFGGQPYAQQYVMNFLYYRWDLNLITDINGNQANITYWQDVQGTGQNAWVRSSYPEYLTYDGGLTSVHFARSSSGELVLRGLDGYLRPDDPFTYGTNPAPKVMENRQLDSIEIRVDSKLIRHYEFAYVTDPSDQHYSTQYGGIYYSGQLKLDSITQWGRDEDTGLSQSLPPMSFLYVNLAIHRTEQYSATYNGNPGNPATLNWYHLTGIKSGYGGTNNTSIAFGYTENPDPNSQLTNIWSREAVTSKIIDAGMGVTQNYTYSYNNEYPQYLGSGCDQKYRGFHQVRETLNQDYVIHYFYTTGLVNGLDTEKLSGREYRTEWYQHGTPDKLLRKVENSWQAQSTGQTIVEGTSSYVGNIPLSSPNDVAVSPDGYVYAVNFGLNYVTKYTATGLFVAFIGIGYLSAPHGVSVSPDGYLYVASAGNNQIMKFNANGGPPVASFGFSQPFRVAAGPDGTVWVTSTSSNYICQYNDAGTLLNYFLPAPPPFSSPYAIALGADGFVYVTDLYQNGAERYDPSIGSPVGGYGPTYTYFAVAVDGEGQVYLGSYSSNLTVKYLRDGTYVDTYLFIGALGLGLGNNYFYASDYTNNRINIFARAYSNWNVQLIQVDETAYNITSGNQTFSTQYQYDGNGNVSTEYHYGGQATAIGQTAVTANDYTIWRAYHPNTSLNILDKPATVSTYPAIVTSDPGTGQKAETDYNYDNQGNSAAPITGNLTSQVCWTDSNPAHSATTGYHYDTYGNKDSETDANNNVTSWNYATDTYHTNPLSKTYPPVTGGTFSETYTYDIGTSNVKTVIDINGQTTTYTYDPLDRLTSVDSPGGRNPDITYEYSDWGIITQQRVVTKTYYDGSNCVWQKEYFDGLGQVIQVQTSAEPIGTHVIVSSTTTYNDVGLVDKQYVSQDITANPDSTYYLTPQTGQNGWKATSYVYDNLGRVTQQNNADGTTVSNDYSTAWQNLTTDPDSHKKRYYYDAFQRLCKVEELDGTYQVYATTNYTYDVLGNLTDVFDNNNVNHTSITYDWLSRKTGMTDPDMGIWSYSYDSNGNLTSQTDAKSQTISMIYDALNRITNKNYPAGSGMTNVTYSYDAWDGITQFGKGQRTGMTDASGSTAYTYNTRGLETMESKIIDSTPYNTQCTYDGADRVVTTTYPITNEVVTQTYNGRNLPNTLYTLSGSVVVNLVDGTQYNNLGSMTQINLHNGLTNYYGYWGYGGTYDNPNGGNYGRLYQIKTGSLQDTTYTWDMAGNLTQRQNVVTGQTESFTYDYLDRLLTAASSPQYNESYTYTPIGNILTKNGVSYGYGSQPHAVTSVGSASYAYDANGNMTSRIGQSIAWDVENKSTNVGADWSWYIDTNHSGAFDAGDTALGPFGKIGDIPLAIDWDGNGTQEIATFHPGGTWIIDTNRNGTYDPGVDWTNSPSTFGAQSGDIPLAIDWDGNGRQELAIFRPGGSWFIDVNHDGIFDTGDWTNSPSTFGAQPGDIPIAIDWDGDGRQELAIYRPSSSTLFIDLSRNGIFDTGDIMLGPFGISGDKPLAVDWDGNGTQELGTYRPGGTWFIDTNRNGTYDTGIDWTSGAGAFGRQTGDMPISIDWDGNGTQDLAIYRPGISFVYDGDGNRVKKIEGGQTTVYVGQYFEKNVTTGIVTTHYYLGGKQIAVRQGSTLSYIYQDSLGSTSVISDSSGASTGTINYLPFGDSRNSTGSLPTDELFTGQRLDSTGLYFYGARYYDPTIGRFISPDTIVPNPKNPQSLNRYSYTLNNPLKYIDPSGRLNISADDYAGDIDAYYGNWGAVANNLMNFATIMSRSSVSMSYGDTNVTAFQGGFVLHQGGIPGEGSLNTAINIALATADLGSSIIGLKTGADYDANLALKTQPSNLSGLDIGAASGPTYEGYVIASMLNTGGTNVDANIICSSPDFGFTADLKWNKSGDQRAGMTPQYGWNLVGGHAFSVALPSGSGDVSLGGRMLNIPFPSNPAGPNDYTGMSVTFRPHYSDGWTRPMTVQVDVK